MTRHGHFHLVRVFNLHFKFKLVKKPSHWVEGLSQEEDAICQESAVSQVLCSALDMRGLVNLFHAFTFTHLNPVLMMRKFILRFAGNMGI